MSASKIEWTGRSDWNPVRGCTRVSEGCRHCYAEQIAGRFSGPGQPFAGFASRRGGEGRWTGRVELVEDRLTLPLRWRKPATIFASSTSDIFHESLPDEAIDRIFTVMALAKRHTFQLLTKRSARMRAYVSRLVDEPAQATARRLARAWPGREPTPDDGLDFPLPNVWLGVSVENQEAADTRVPDLLATPAGKRFLSCEPLLGPVNLDWFPVFGPDRERLLHWVIVGGESGRGARPMHPAWARSLRDQCATVGVPFFFKQWGAWAPLNTGPVEWSGVNTAWPDGSFGSGGPQANGGPGEQFHLTTKTAAGRLLDGVEHNGVPA